MLCPPAPAFDNRIFCRGCDEHYVTTSSTNSGAATDLKRLVFSDYFQTMLCIFFGERANCVITEYKRLQTKTIHVNGVLPDLSFNFLAVRVTSPTAAVTSSPSLISVVLTKQLRQRVHCPFCLAFSFIKVDERALVRTSKYIIMDDIN